jgi:spore maturation protein SpmA
MTTQMLVTVVVVCVVVCCSALVRVRWLERREVTERLDCFVRAS